MSSCSRVTGASWLKSKRRRPGRDERAALRRARRRAPRGAPRAEGACPEWWRTAPSRCIESTTSRAVWSTCTSPRTTLPRCTIEPADRALHVLDVDPAGRRLDHAAVADLAAALGVEGRLLGDDLDRVALARLRARAAPRTTSARTCESSEQRVVAAEARLEVGRELRVDRPDRAPRRSPSTPRARARAARPSPRRSRPGRGRARSPAQDVLGQVDREAEGVVELEHDVAGQRRAARAPSPRATSSWSSASPLESVSPKRSSSRRTRSVM